MLKYSQSRTAPSKLSQKMTKRHDTWYSCGIFPLSSLLCKKCIKTHYFHLTGRKCSDSQHVVFIEKTPTQMCMYNTAAVYASHKFDTLLRGGFLNEWWVVLYFVIGEEPEWPHFRDLQAWTSSHRTITPGQSFPRPLGFQFEGWPELSRRHFFWCSTSNTGPACYERERLAKYGLLQVVVRCVCV